MRMYHCWMFVLLVLPATLVMVEREDALFTLEVPNEPWVQDIEIEYTHYGRPFRSTFNANPEDKTVSMTMPLTAGDMVSIISKEKDVSCANVVQKINPSHIGGSWQWRGKELAGCPNVDWADGPVVFIPNGF